MIKISIPMIFNLSVTLVGGLFDKLLRAELNSMLICFQDDPPLATPLTRINPQSTLNLFVSSRKIFFSGRFEKLCRKRSDHLDWIARNCLAGQQSGQTLLYSERRGSDCRVGVVTLGHHLAQVSQTGAAMVRSSYCSHINIVVSKSLKSPPVQMD